MIEEGSYIRVTSSRDVLYCLDHPLAGRLGRVVEQLDCDTFVVKLDTSGISDVSLKRIKEYHTFLFYGGFFFTEGEIIELDGVELLAHAEELASFD